MWALHMGEGGEGPCTWRGGMEGGCGMEVHLTSSFCINGFECMHSNSKGNYDKSWL